MAQEYPSVSLDDQRRVALSLGVLSLSCLSCSGRGVLAAMTTLRSARGQEAGPFSHVVVCPDCCGAGMDWDEYRAARERAGLVSQHVPGQFKRPELRAVS